MTVSSNIQKYVENSKINGKLCKWDKNFVNIFVTPITANISDALLKQTGNKKL